MSEAKEVQKSSSDSKKDIKFCVFIATSLDGFISREDGGIDWLEEPNSKIPNEDYGYAEFTKDVGVLVMGTNTFDKVLEFKSWYYGKLPVIVLSRTRKSLPSLSTPPPNAEFPPFEIPSTVTLSDKTPTELADELRKKGITKVYVDGGKVIQSFLDAGLIDEVIITLVPVLLGRGLPLFGPLKKDLWFDFVGTKTFENGFVQNHYKVRK